MDLWAGRVRIFKGDDGRVRIGHQAEGEAAETVYEPHGFLEGKAIKGLVEKLLAVPGNAPTEEKPDSPEAGGA